MRRTIAIAIIVALLLHAFFIVVVAPQLELDTTPPSRTEVVEISPQELQKLKEKIMAKQRQANQMPLAENEVLPQYQTKEAPKTARMAGPQNQTVPEETLAPLQNEASQTGGGGAKAKRRQNKLELSKLGLGTKLAKPVPPSEEIMGDGDADRQGPLGPSGQFRPRGLDDKHVKRGSQNLLNAVQSPFYSFWARLFRPIEENFYFFYRQMEREIGNELVQIKARPGTQFVVGMEITIDNQGNMVSVRIVNPSGLPSFDRMTRQAILKVGAVPNPPPGIFEGRDYYAHVMNFGLYYENSAIFNSGDRGGF